MICLVACRYNTDDGRTTLVITELSPARRHSGIGAGHFALATVENKQGMSQFCDSVALLVSVEGFVFVERFVSVELLVFAEGQVRYHRHNESAARQVARRVAQN